MYCIVIIWFYVTTVVASSVMSSLDCIWKERRLPLPIKICVYLALVQSVLFYASETLTSADAKSLEAFHMKCQRRILRISWRQFVRNSEISALTGLPTINDVIRHPTLYIAVFGHIARLQDNTPAHKPLQSHVNLSLGRLPHPSWSRRPGRPRGSWIDEIKNDTSQTPADLWRQAPGRGHRGRAMRRPTLAMRWWWWWWLWWIKMNIQSMQLLYTNDQQ